MRLNKLRNIIFSKHLTPPFLIFFVTNKCDFKCRHCFNWQKIDQGKDDLSFHEIEKLTKELETVYNLLLSGGEPFLRDDLAEIINLFYTNNKTRRISIPTNSYRPCIITGKAKQILEKAKGAILEIQLSLDGTENIHNEIRGKEDSFKKTIETYEALKKLKEKHNNLRINIAVTVNNKNAGKLKELKDYIKINMNNCDSVFWGFMRGQPRDSSMAFASWQALEDLHKVNNFCQAGFTGAVLNDTFFHMKNKMLKLKKQIVECSAGDLIGVIDNDGDVRFCEMLVPVGNLKENTFRQIWHGKKAYDLREKIKNDKCYCTHECFIAPSVLYKPGNYLKAAPFILKALRHQCFKR
ncbi:MAG: radical SAM protein [Candidatus Omnitrophota bacterium]